MTIDVPDRHVRHRHPAPEPARSSAWQARAGNDGRIALSEADVRILATLQREGRISKSALADRVNLSASACFERMQRLEKQKVIVSYHATVNLRALVQLHTFFTEVTLKSHHAYDFRRFEAFVQTVPEIVECHALGGGIDYVLKIASRDVDDYQAMIDRLLDSEIGIDRYFTYIVTKVVKSLPQFQVENLL
ncbi:Lrp/AsnC family transcriptional regulator of ectoine degradation [Stella humosa]|uniref:Lrp/AsnC family transcriptional regulator of ectoine degradation n=1 Tax=Stella humosa TaxID=94 RepID=A0A3N1KT04_9PROT|nr:Lrp/AsnC family transcriptional regulator [Stella humosa]ROP83124.1 Lrp/AsnC family transcriptional regulator of ectoine degradation [Stella humosa]BBK30099.1 AsnC family transcriptional regulator [Stella humosa]